MHEGGWGYCGIQFLCQIGGVDLGSTDDGACLLVGWKVPHTSCREEGRSSHTFAHWMFHPVNWILSCTHVLRSQLLQDCGGYSRNFYIALDTAQHFQFASHAYKVVTRGNGGSLFLFWVYSWILHMLGNFSKCTPVHSKFFPGVHVLSHSLRQILLVVVSKRSPSFTSLAVCMGDQCLFDMHGLALSPGILPVQVLMAYNVNKWKCTCMWATDETACSIEDTDQLQVLLFNMNINKRVEKGSK